MLKTESTKTHFFNNLLRGRRMGSFPPFRPPPPGLRKKKKKKKKKKKRKRENDEERGVFRWRFPSFLEEWLDQAYAAGVSKRM